MDHINEAISRIDWQLLAEQKLALFRACRQDPTLDGLLHMIDAIQDAAHADGHPVVFLGAGGR